MLSPLLGSETTTLSQLAYIEDEAARRLAVVDDYAIREASPEDCLNTYVRLAAALCETPIALVSIVMRDAQHFPARYGLTLQQTSLPASFCVRAIEHTHEILVVPDTLRDPRFSDNPLVVGEPFVRFYAGVPLITPEGVALGTLCVMGPEPRTLDSRSEAALRVLRDAVMATLEEKRQRRWSHEANPFLFERNPNPMWIYDLQTLKFLAVNDATTRQYGYSREQFLEMTLRDIRPAHEHAALADRIAQVGHGLAHSKGWKHRKRDGSLIDVTITSEEVRYGDRPARLVLATDITRETQAEEALVHLAHHDALTGLLNRAGFNEAFDKALASASRSNIGGAALFLDLERFKAINDALGHAAGDDLLVCVARRLRALSRQDDLVARTGGDEFVMFVPGLSEREPAERFIADIVEAIRQPFCIENQTHSIGITIGASFYPSNGTTATTLLKAADIAMYRAKRSSSSIAFHDPDIR